MGYCDSCDDFEEFKKGFDKTVSRGPDDSRIVDTGKGLLGFHRLSIMGLTPDGMQPFELDGSYAICNGELYGFEKMKEKLSKKYSFKSGSDCEIILPMYREYGVDMFKMLDAEFAMIIYDGETGEYIAARDPIGIRPLYYGHDKKGTIVLQARQRTLSECARILCRSLRDIITRTANFIATATLPQLMKSATIRLTRSAQKFTTNLLQALKKDLLPTQRLDFFFRADLILLLFAQSLRKRVKNRSAHLQSV